MQVSGDIVSVKESAAAVDYALLASQGVNEESLHPESEVKGYLWYVYSIRLKRVFLE